MNATLLVSALLLAALAGPALAKGRQPDPAPYEPIRFEELPPMPESAPAPQAQAPAVPEPDPEAASSNFVPADAPEPVAPDVPAPPVSEEVMPEPPVEPAAAVVPKPPPPMTRYKVWIWQETGDTLARIARKVYGDASKWELIYLANRDVIKDPNKIYPKQKLKIPPADWQPE